MGFRVVSVIAIVASATAFSADIDLADPGSVVKWDGGEILECIAFGERWAPLDGACFFPIDLMREEGLLTLQRTTAHGTQQSEIRVGPSTYPVQKLTVAPRMVDLSEEDRERARREGAVMVELWSRRGPALFHLPLGPPLEELPKGRSFGSRRVFNGQPRSPHKGVDYTAVTGTPTIAVEQGRVVLAEELFFGGNSVFVDHGGGLISIYMHLHTIEVNAGQDVVRGQRLGTVGATGRVTGAHLHFSLRWLNACVDPTPLLSTSFR